MMTTMMMKMKILIPMVIKMKMKEQVIKHLITKMNQWIILNLECQDKLLHL
jgi:mannose/fructose/N-acetylgalactosamine-specific phosphotransferase system component IIC